MTRALVAPRPRLSGRFILAVAIAFVLQAALLFFFGREPVKTIQLPERVAGYQLTAPSPADWVALHDPTLFVLPHRLGFSGSTWMNVSAPRFELRTSTESPFTLPLDVQSLGQAFAHYAAKSGLGSSRPLPLPEPPLVAPRLVFTPPVRLESALRIEGELASRSLLNPEPLPSVTEAFTNTVVEVLVDPEGYVFSSVLTAGSGSTNDALALNFARARRFASISPTGPQREIQPPAPMMQGTLIFEWRPSLNTNTPAIVP